MSLEGRVGHGRFSLDKVDTHFDNSAKKTMKLDYAERRSDQRGIIIWVKGTSLLEGGEITA